MIVGIELGKEYVQLSVKTDMMKDPESVAQTAGTEQYRIPTEADLSDKVQLQALFRKLWNWVQHYGSRRALEYLVFCLEDLQEDLKENLLEIVQGYELDPEKVVFLDKKECFCSYVMHQKPELSAQLVVLIDHHAGEKKACLLRKHQTQKNLLVEVRDASEYSMEEIFGGGPVSAVFLVGDDFEEEWMQDNLRFLKKGRRVFAGKNLYVKGAAYRGMDLTKGETYLYLNEETVRCDIGLKCEEEGKEFVHTMVSGGKNWQQSDVSVDVLLLDEPKLEFVISPMDGSEASSVEVVLEHLPERPKKTTRLNISLKFRDACHAALIIRDLGFGELFPKSDMFFEGELKWEQ